MKKIIKLFFLLILSNCTYGQYIQLINSSGQSASGGGTVYASSGTHMDEDTVKLGGNFEYEDIVIQSNTGKEYYTATSNTVSTSSLTLDTNAISFSLQKNYPASTFVSSNMYYDYNSRPYMDWTVTGRLSSNNSEIEMDSSGLFYTNIDTSLFGNNHLITNGYLNFKLANLPASGSGDSSWLSARVGGVNSYTVIDSTQNITTIRSAIDTTYMRIEPNNIVIGQFWSPSQGLGLIIYDHKTGITGINSSLYMLNNKATIMADTLTCDSCRANFKTLTIDGKQAATTNYVTQAIDSLSMAETVSRTIYVATTGSDVTGDGSVGNPFATPLRAYQDIKPIINNGVIITINVVAGTYSYNASAIQNIKRNVSLRDNASILEVGKNQLVVNGFTLSAGSPNVYVYTVSGATFTANEHQDRFLYNGTNYFPIVLNSTNTINTTIGAASSTSIYENTVIYNLVGNIIESNFLNVQPNNEVSYNYINFSVTGQLEIVTNSSITFNACKISATNILCNKTTLRLLLKNSACVLSTGGIEYRSMDYRIQGSSLRKSGSKAGTGVSCNFTNLSSYLGQRGLYLYNWATGIDFGPGIHFNNTASSGLILDNITTGLTVKSNTKLTCLAATIIHLNSVTTFLNTSETAVGNYDVIIGAVNGTATTFGSGITTNGLCNISKNIHIEIPSISTQGTAVLVAGTVTISTAAVQTGSEILVSCKTPGGTQGFLSIGTITAGTSFVVNSSSGTDTSTILWQIIK